MPLRNVVYVGAATACGLLFTVAAGSQQNPEAVRAFMRGKLDASREILSGLVEPDYERIAGGADELLVMSRRAEWNVVATDEYRQMSEEFRRLAKSLGDAGRQKNPDAAGLAYVRLTTSCVECHRHIRSTKVSHTPFTMDGAVTALTGELK